MPIHLSIFIRCVSLIGLFVALQLASVALAADDADSKKPEADRPPDAKQPAADGASDQKRSTPDAPPATQTVHALLLVRAVPPTVWPAVDKKLDPQEFDLYKRKLPGIVKSHTVINRALNDKSVGDLPLIKEHGGKVVDWLSDQIAVEFPAKGELMQVSMTAGDRDQACAIVNAVVAAFIKEFVDQERSDRLTQHDQLTKKFYAYREQILDKKRQLYEYQRQLGKPYKELAARIRRQIAGLEQLAAESRRAEIQAELQLARARHKLESLADPSAEFKAAKAEAELAEVDEKFWDAKSTTLAEAIEKLYQQLASNEKFQGDADLIRADIEQLHGVIEGMGYALSKWNIELDAEPRIRLVESAGP